MKHLLSLLLICLSCLATGQNNTQLRKDSLRAVIAHSEGEAKLKAYQQLTNIYFPESGYDDLKTDTLLTLYNEMIAESQQQKDLVHEGVAKGNILRALFNKKMYEDVIKRAPEYLDFFAGNEMWKTHYMCYQTYLRAYQSKGDTKKALSETQLLYDAAKERGHKDGIAYALFIMANIYEEQNRLADQERCIRECIENLKGNTTLLSDMPTIYYYFCQSLIKQGRYEEALKELMAFEEINKRYEEASGSPQPTAWGSTWRCYILLYLHTHEYDKAEAYCDTLENSSTDDRSMFTVYNARAEIYNARKQYESAWEMTNKAMALAGEESIESKDVREIQMEILAKMGRAEDLYALAKVAAAFQDSIRNLEFNKQLDELHTIYEVDKIEAEAQIKEMQYRNRLTFILIVAILALLALVVILYFYRKKQVAYRELVRKGQQWAEIVPPMDICADPTEYTASAISKPVDPMPDIADNTIMESLEQVMKEKKLYVDPELSLDKLADTLDTNRYYLSKAINHCTGKNYATYVNEFRVKEAIRIMSDKKNSHLSVDGVAYESGFSDRTSFYRIFKKMTGLSPASFRSNLQAS